MRRNGDPAVLLNTSLNVHGEPLVCRPEQAVEIFRSGSADALVLGNLICLGAPAPKRAGVEGT